MPWNFEVISAPRFRTDLSQLGSTVDLTLREVSSLLIWNGNEQIALGDLCKITPSADGVERWCGSLDRVDGIGAGNAGRTIAIEGSVGNRAGAGMSAGSIRIRGDAGNDLGLDLAGGTIIVEGSSGSRTGSFSPGAARGMRGGAIVITGNVGEEAGQKMRRGLLAVGGKAGSGAGNLMIAGTIISGELSGSFGQGLKRGSIISRTQPKELPVWFGPAVGVELSFAGLLSRTLSRLIQNDAFAFLADSRWHRAQGDRLQRSQGELLFR
jgi:formylmethanofuran dehydrogenase subunit C